MAGAATPAVELKNPPITPVGTMALRRESSGVAGEKRVTARPASTTAPTATCNHALGTQRTTSAPATIPGTADATSTAACRHSTNRRTDRVIRKPEHVVAAFVARTPGPGPMIRDSTGATTRPTPVPDTRCRTVPTSTASRAAMRINMGGFR